jgi:hypothetical protein
LSSAGLVVQSRTVEQENVLGALAQRIDLGAVDVDVRLGERIGDRASRPGRSPATISR